MTLSHASEYARLTDHQLMLIGRFVTEWANLEFCLGVIVSRLLLTPSFLSRTYTDRTSAAQIQDTINQAIEIHSYRYNSKLIDEKILNEIRSLNVKISTLRSLRNKFAHFCWMRNTDENIFGTSFLGATPKNAKLNKSIASLSNKEISEHNAELYQTIERLYEIISLLPEIQEEHSMELFSRRRESS